MELAGETGGSCASLDTELRWRKCVGAANGIIRDGSKGYGMFSSGRRFARQTMLAGG